jgi:HlyD family secretion protein
VANGNGKNGKNKRRKKFIIGGVTLLVLVVIVGVAAASRGGKSIDPSKLAKVEKGDLARSVVATGKIEPITKVEIKSKASGIVKQIHVEAGDTVKQGQVLVELDKEEIQARVREARAALEAADAHRRAAEAEFERGKVDAQGPEVPLLERAYERAKQMASEGVVSQAALDEAQRAFEMAVNKREVARAQLSIAKARVSQAMAQVQQARANLERAEEEYRNSTILAPMSGLVLSRNVEIGDAVSSILVQGANATLVMTVGDTSEVYVKGRVDESDIGKVYMDQPARIKVESFRDKTFEGAVTQISPMGVERDNVTTFEVRVSITNPSGELKAAMTANAEIILEERKDVLIIPEGAVIYDKERKASVQVPDASTKEGRKTVAVQLGISNGARTQVMEGLNEGQQVILQ